MNDDSGGGPPFRFPDGTTDGGELPALVGRSHGQVLIGFVRPVTWLALPPDAARDLAVRLIRYAEEVDGRPFTLEL